MQFRQQGYKTQVLAYRGYDKEKKRAVVQLLGSFDSALPKPSKELLDKLTDNEKSKLQSHIKAIQQSHRSALSQAHVRSIASHIEIVSDSLTSPECASLLTPESVSDTYRALDRLAKQLRKLGHRRPAKTSTVTPPSI